MAKKIMTAALCVKNAAVIITRSRWHREESRDRRFDKLSDRLYLNAPAVRILLYAVLNATDAVIKGAALSAALRSGRHLIGA